MPARKYTNPKEPLRILVVEDELPWQTALGELYKTWFPEGRQTVVDNAADARRILRGGGADLLSLDLNLSRAPRAGTEQHGLKLLTDLAKHHWARAVCIITLAQVDWHLRDMMLDANYGRMLERLKACPHHTLNKFLGVNGIVMHKLEEKTPNENVSLFLRTVDLRDVKALLNHAFVLTFAGDGLHETLRAELSCRVGSRKGRVLFEGADAEFLERLAKARQKTISKDEFRVDFVTDKEVADVYGQPYVPDGPNKNTPIHSLKRRLRKEGLHGLEFFVRVRSTHGDRRGDAGAGPAPGGWRLNQQVSIKNAATKKEWQLGEMVAQVPSRRRDDES